MKKSILMQALCATIAIALSSASIEAINPINAYMGPGPVTAISVSYNQVPQEIFSFVAQNFDGAAVTGTIMKEIAGTIYSVTLTNGYRLKFDHRGRCIATTAPTNRYIPAPAVKRVLPGKAYKHLKQQGMEQRVEHTAFNAESKCYDVQVNRPSQGRNAMQFNSRGRVTEPSESRPH